jgi:AmiR/NasT family two-component response regulator
MIVSGFVPEVDNARMDNGGRQSMTNSTNSHPLSPGDLIEQATGIIMDRFNIDTVRASDVLRKMSQNTSTQMCVIAEQVINHDVPVEAVRGLEDAVRDFR